MMEAVEVVKTIKLHYSEKILKQAIRSFFFRGVIKQLGFAFWTALSFLIVFIFYLMMQGRSDWFLHLLISTFFFIGMLFLTIYVAHYRNTLGRFRQMRSPEATFSYDREQFTLASDLGSATMPWSAVSEVWKFPKFWLLVFSPGQFVTLPLANVDEDAKVFILGKIPQKPSKKS